MKETGTEYPKLKLGEVEHTIRFTRGAFAYHMSKKGLDLADLRSALKVTGTLTDVLMFTMEPRWTGTPEELADILIDEQKMAEANVAVHVALGKVFPTPIAKPAAAAGDGRPQLQ